MAKFMQRVERQRLDTEWQGDNLSGHTDIHHTRIMFHNVNGLTVSGVEGFDMFVNEQASLHVDIQCFSEHCLDTTKFYVTQAARDTLRQHFPGQSTIQLNSSAESAINIYKPGGTGILVLGDIVSRQEPNGRGGDTMGRWSYIHLRRRDSSPVTIISAYQVCPSPTNPLGNTAYHQQVRALNNTGVNSLHPRRAFMRDLSSFIETLLLKGHDIILGGDFNETLEDKHSGLLQLVTTHQLTDPFLSRFPHHENFGTHIMGTRRIDSVFLTPGLLPSLTSIGYAPFDYATTSDHRPIIMDFHTKSLFGQYHDAIPPVTSRLLRTKDKKAVTTFINRWYQEVQMRGGFALNQQLQSDTADPNVVELVDEILGSSGDIAERACKRRRPQFFSQQLVQNQLRVSILRGHLRAMKIGSDRSSQLKQRMIRGGLDFPLPETQYTTKLALRQANKDLHQTEQQHMETRQAELDAKIDEAVMRGNKPRSQALQSIRKVETNHTTYKILQAMRKRTVDSHSIDRLEIPASWPAPFQSIESVEQLEDPKTCTEWRLITSPTQVEYYLMLRNRLHFGQAEGTPFTFPPLSEDVDWSASTTAADQLLDGSYQYPSTIPNCDALLQACKKATSFDDLPAELTLADFKGKIQIWRESTTTSPSGRHLGRYKALFGRGVFDAEDNSEELPFTAKQEALCELILAVINYCIRNNYVLHRWKKVINVMIFKEAGNFKIHRLRVIHIYEADFNLILAVKWRQLLRSADENKLINEGQYGGRPGCEAQSLTLLEELKYDLAYLTRRTLFNFDNDAASCYDRIVVPMASLINRKYGMNEKIVAVHASTLQQAQFHLKTAAGVSERFYSPSSRFPIHGTGQGSGNSPCIWLFISSTLFDTHSTLAHGAKFVTPDGNHSVAFSMVGFVDDSTGTCNDFLPQHEAPMSDLLQRMESDAQIWSNLLYCSGGKLELQKCSFHVLRFQFRPNGQPIPALDTYDNRIHIRDLETNASVPIPSKRAFEAHRTLGHFKSPYAKQAMELTNLKRKADRMALLISNAPITRQGASLAYNTVYIPSIQYTLPQSFFTKKDLDNAQASSVHRILPKCGYNRNTSRAIIYAPKAYAGGGFLPWYLLQGEGQVKHFIKHWRTRSIVSNTLRVAVSWAQWQSGHSISIFEDTQCSQPHLECRWLTSLRDFLGHIHAKIYIDMAIVAKPETTQDIFIMDYAIQCGLFNPQDLRIINYCRLYLHVTTVSELFDTNGTRMIPELFQCYREPWFNQATFITLQKRPSAYQVRMKWQKLCRQWSDASGNIAASLHLGNWRISGQHLRRRRQTYFSTQRPQRLYHFRQGCYWEFTRDGTAAHHYRPLHPTTWEPTSSCVPITVTETKEDQLVVIPQSRRRPRPGRTPHIMTTFLQYIQSLAEWEQQFMHGITMLAQPYETIQAISNLPESSHVLLVSDGSQKHNRITYGWVFGSNTKDIYAEHSGEGYGETTSHRAEAFGMLSGLLFVYHLCRYTNTYQPGRPFPVPIKFVSDNQGLVTRVSQRRQYVESYPNATLSPDWDIIEQIHDLLALLPTTDIDIDWVKGHQDEDDIHLSSAASFNIRADKLAGEVPSFQPISLHHQDPPLLPAEKCRLQIDGSIIQSHFTRAIRYAYTIPEYYSYLKTRHGWTQQQVQTIDWDVFCRAADNVSFASIQLTKLIHDKLPTNYELSKSNPHHSPKCHYCSEQESFAHLLTCDNDLSLTFRRDLLDSVQIYMENRETSEDFQLCFLHGIQIACGIQLPEQRSSAHTLTMQCLQAQSQLGKHSLFRGHLTSSWRQLYATTTHCEDVMKDPTNFLAGLVKHLWQAQLEFWDRHLQAIHASTENGRESSHEKLLQYRTRIRLLHSYRDQCLHGHRELYFHQDIDSFLNTATGTQMRQYLHHYESAIYRSMKAAKTQPSRTLLTFPGFSRLVKQSPRPRIPQETTPPNQLSIGNRGALQNRKHTRWKMPGQVAHSIRQFFHTQPNPD